MVNGLIAAIVDRKSENGRVLIERGFFGEVTIISCVPAHADRLCTECAGPMGNAVNALSQCIAGTNYRPVRNSP